MDIQKIAALAVILGQISFVVPAIATDDLPPLPMPGIADTAQPEEKAEPTSLPSPAAALPPSNPLEDKEIEEQLKELDRELDAVEDGSLPHSHQNSIDQSEKVATPAAEKETAHPPATAEETAPKAEEVAVPSLEEKPTVPSLPEVAVPTIEPSPTVPAEEPPLPKTSATEPPLDEQAKITEDKTIALPVEPVPEKKEPEPVTSEVRESVPPPVPVAPIEQAETAIEKPPEDKVVTKQEDPEQQQFMINEGKLLLLPNDDIVLGDLMPEARLEQIDFIGYVQDYKKAARRMYETTEARSIKSFITNYDRHRSKVDEFKKYAKREAFVSVSKSNISALRVLIDDYPVLQAEDRRGGGLLHRAVRLDNYLVAKYLILRGINLNKRDQDNESPLTIAQRLPNNQIENLLIRAGKKF